MYSKYDKQVTKTLERFTESGIDQGEVPVDSRYINAEMQMTNGAITEDQIVNDLTVKELLARSFAKHTGREVYIFKVYMENLDIFKTADIVIEQTLKVEEIIDAVRETIIREMKVSN